MNAKVHLLLSAACSVCLCVLDLSFAGEPGQQQVNTIAPGVMLSELTLDRPLGSDGSWVELYNPTDSPFPLDGISILWEGNKSFAFPKGIQLPGKGIVVVHFSPEAPDVEGSARTLRRDNSMTVRTKPLLHLGRPAPEKRKPGWCALVRGGGEAMSHVLDYVQWGVTRLDEQGEKVHQRAVQAGLWPGDTEGIYIGVPRMRGARLASLDRVAVLYRVGFDVKLRLPECWIVLPEAMGTPGAGNARPAPILHSPGRGAGIAADQDLSISILERARIPSDDRMRPGGHSREQTEGGRAAGSASGRNGDLPYRVQISKDPHFQEVVYDGRFATTGAIKEGRLKPGRYYARVRLDSGLVSTDWSEVHYFIYE